MSFKLSLFQKMVIFLSVLALGAGVIILLEKPPAGNRHNGDTPPEFILEKIAGISTPPPLSVVSPEEKEKLREMSKINVNTATAEELTTVPGIGPSTARSIVKYRSDHLKGEKPVFKKLEDLTKIPRIGEKKLQRMKDYLTVGWDVIQAYRSEEVSGKKPSEDGLININTALQDDLVSLSGVGPATAERIIDYRNKHGFFATKDDLTNIPGIGSKTLDRFRDKITVGEEGRKAALQRKYLPGPRSPSASTPKISLNRASAEELTKLPGIGPATAERIVNYRKTIRQFRTLEQLMDVPGIGPGTFERIKPLLKLY